MWGLILTGVVAALSDNLRSSTGAVAIGADGSLTESGAVDVGQLKHEAATITNRSKDDAAPVFITLTTTPERLHSNWFQQSLTNLMSLDWDYKVVLNIPRVQKSTGMVYMQEDSTAHPTGEPRTAQKAQQEVAESSDMQEIPAYIYRWAAQDSRLKLHRCDDAGPLTKLMGSLDNPNIPSDALLLVVDDDQIYKPELVRLLAMAHEENKDDVVTMCTTPLEGFKGFAATKAKLAPLSTMPRPAACFRVDDAYVQEAVTKLGLATIAVEYPGFKADQHDCPAVAHGRKWCKWKSMCSVDIAGFTDQPNWRTLNEDEKDNTRNSLDRECRVAMAAQVGTPDVEAMEKKMAASTPIDTPLSL